MINTIETRNVTVYNFGHNADYNNHILPARDFSNTKSLQHSASLASLVVVASRTPPENYGKCRCQIRTNFEKRMLSNPAKIAQNVVVNNRTDFTCKKGRCRKRLNNLHVFLCFSGGKKILFIDNLTVRTLLE